MSYYLDNDAANAVETTRQRQEREERERIGALLAQAREALSARPNSKLLQGRVAQLNKAMNILQRFR